MTEIKIKNLEERYDLRLLSKEEIVEVEGRKKPMMCWANDSKEMEFIGRKNGSCISHIITDSNNPSIRNKKIVFNRPYQTYSYFPNESHYNFLDKELNELGL